MGFLGSTGFKSFIGSGARQLREDIVAADAPKELSFEDKEALKFRYTMFEKQIDKYKNVDDNIVNFGDTYQYVMVGPNNEQFPYNEYEFSISTSAKENPQEQAAAFKNYTQISDVRFENLPPDEKDALKLYVVNHGDEYFRLLNEQESGQPKVEGQLDKIPRWENIIPNSPKWVIEALYANQSLKMGNYNADVVENIPQEYLKKVAEGQAMAYEGVTDYGGLSNIADKIETADLQNAENEMNLNILAHHVFKHGEIEVGKEKTVINRHVTQRKTFPEFFTANRILAEAYLTEKEHPYGQAFNSMPTLPESFARETYLKVVPLSYKAAVENPQGLYPSEVFNRNNIELYKSMYKESNIVQKKYSPTNQYWIQGTIDKSEVIDDLNIDMDVYSKRGDAWQQYKGTHKLLMLELSDPSKAIGGRGYENIALGIDMVTNVSSAIGNIRNRMLADNQITKGRFSNFINRMLKKTDKLIDQPLSAGEKKWLNDHGFEGNVENASLTEAAQLNLNDPNVRNTTSQNNLLLASIARQRALTLELTYLAAAVVQGEGGKAISDGDQKQFKQALSYGWWSTPEQRIAAADAIFESLSLYGEVALAYKAANTAEELYGIREYERVSDITDFRNQAGKSEVFEDAAFDGGEDSGQPPKKLSVSIKGLISKDDYDTVTIDNIAVHKNRLMSLYKDNLLEDNQIAILQQIDPDIFLQEKEEN